MVTNMGLIICRVDEGDLITTLNLHWQLTDR